MIPVFINCPKCGDPLINDFLPENKIRKHCKKRLDHQFQCIISASNELEAFSITISMDPLTRVGWEFNQKKCVVNVGTIQDIIRRKDDGFQLPYWDPDLSNWEELVRKVKAYLTFS